MLARQPRSFAFPLLSLFAALALSACGPQAETGAPSAAPVTVLAAASLTDALTEVGEAYRAETGEVVQFSFASSSTLARQIEAGAPADIFASADRQWMDYLAERDLIDESSRTEPIANSLVLIAPSDSPLDAVTPDASLDLPALLGPDGRMAVGDPDHVPAGIYGRQALTSLGLWETAEPRLARADDVRSALALVSRGEAPLGIVYSTDASITPDVKTLGVFPADSHEPVVYPFALLGDAPSDEAQRFFDYATGPDAAAVYERYGFARP